MVRASLRVAVLAAAAAAGLAFAVPTTHVQADTDGNGTDANNGTLPDASAVWMRWLNGTTGNGTDTSIRVEIVELRAAINSILAQLAEIREQLNGTMPVQPAEKPPLSVGVFVSQQGHNPDCARTESCFIPSTLTVTAGSRVYWDLGHPDYYVENVTDHVIVSNVTNVGYIGSPGAYVHAWHTFSEPGTYPYYCGIHPHMQGTIIVE